MPLPHPKNTHAHPTPTSQTILPGHPGILMQLYTATGVLPSTWATGLLVLVTWNVIGALAPWSPTYSQFNLLVRSTS